MTAFVRTQPDSAWIAGYTPAQSDFEDWDRKVAASLNGDDGGTWAPISPIVITNGVGGAETAILCPVKVCYGARFTTASGGRFAISGPKFEQLAPGHVGSTRALLTPMAGAIVEPAASAVPMFLANAIALLSSRITVDLAPPPADLVNDPWQVGPFVEQTARVTQVLRTHDGATLASVTLTYRPGTSKPRVRILRYDANGDATPITLATGDADGWAALPAPDAALDVQSSTIACDPGVVVDKSLYSYGLQVDVVPADKATRFLLKRPARLVATTNASAMTGTPIIDGVQTVDGDIVLLVGQVDQKQNGLWVIGSGVAFFPVGITQPVLGDYVAYTSEGFFPAGYVVAATDGVHAGTFWQCQSKEDFARAVSVRTATTGSTTTTTLVTGKLMNHLGVPAGTNPSLEIAQRFAQLEPTGGTYLAAVAHHTGIIDTRWQ